MSDGQKVKILTEEEKDKILRNRESTGDNSKILREVLHSAVETMKKSPYCRKILEGANYQEFSYTKRKPEEFDLNGFYLQEIYIGHHTGPQGHCTKELYTHEEDPRNPINGTRDAVFIADNIHKSLLPIGKTKSLAEIVEDEKEKK